MIFLINVPVGLVGTVLSLRYLPRFERDPSARLDLVGAVLLAAASALLIYPLVQGRELGWPAWTYLMMAGSAVAFVGFVLSEQHSTHPVIEGSLFGNRGFVAGLVFLGTFFVAMSGLMLIINLFIQLGLGFSPLHTGVTMTPLALGLAIGAAVSGAVLGPKFGRTLLHGGLMVIALGVLRLWWTLGATSIGGWDLAPALFVAGLGSGMIFAPLFDIILADLGDHEVGTGSGLLNAVQQFAGAVGVAVIGTVFFSWLPDRGWFDATRAIIWVSIACYALSFMTVFLLPRRAREDSVLLG